MRLRAKGTSVPLDALQKTAKLLRSFAEDYHEKQLEEARRAKGERRQFLIVCFLYGATATLTGAMELALGASRERHPGIAGGFEEG